MVIPSFNFARCPHIIFGSGSFADLPDLANGLGERVLVVTGAHSLQASGRWDLLKEGLDIRSVDFLHLPVRGEPSPQMVDDAVLDFRGSGIGLVMAVGGGSVIDAGKAVSAMLLEGGSVMDYLEGVGKGAQHSGTKVSFIAVPTTAGTGSEATKNAVLSQVGPGGFKRSLRHDNFVPDIAVIDPELALSCPADITSACGMDALTQLLESYVSTTASPITDALALSGLEQVRDNLVPASTTGSGDIEVRAGMAYASLLSGMTLANAGLGVVHGFASVIGGLYPAPHGVICGTLLGEATRANIEWLLKERGTEDESLRRYARAGTVLTGRETEDIQGGCELLVDTIDEWTRILSLPLLGEYGLSTQDIDGIVEETGLKNNPAVLGREELRAILERRIQG
jgi:alcohol dehydrogenase class IV